MDTGYNFRVTPRARNHFQVPPRVKNGLIVVCAGREGTVPLLTPKMMGYPHVFGVYGRALIRAVLSIGK